LNLDSKITEFCGGFWDFGHFEIQISRLTKNKKRILDICNMAKTKAVGYDYYRI